MNKTKRIRKSRAAYKKRYFARIKKEDPERYTVIKKKKATRQRNYYKEMTLGLRPKTPSYYRNNTYRKGTLTPHGRKTITAYQKKRQNKFRQEFLDANGNKCCKCSAIKNLIIKHTGGLINHQGCFAFQPVAMLSQEKRDEILKDCILICWKCANSIYKKNKLP